MDVPFREVAPVIPLRNNATTTGTKTILGFWDNMPLEEIRTLPPPLYNTYRKDKPPKLERIEKSSIYEVGIMLFLTYLMILVAHVGMLVLANLNAAGQ